jgi:hypothetical protein
MTGQIRVDGQVPVGGRWGPLAKLHVPKTNLAQTLWTNFGLRPNSLRYYILSYMALFFRGGLLTAP